MELHQQSMVIVWMPAMALSHSEPEMEKPTHNRKQEEPGTPSKIVVLPLPSQRKYSDFERYPQTPEYNVQPEPELEVGRSRSHPYL